MSTGNIDNTDIISPARADWATRISGLWADAVRSILATGAALAEAKAALPHGEFAAMIETDLPFGARTAQMLMKIGGDPRLSNAKHVSHLPAAWGTLYSLTRLDDDAFAAAFAEGRIHPDMERKDADLLTRAVRRVERLDRAEASSAGAAPGDGADVRCGDATDVPLPPRKYPVIYADPPWLQETRSEKGREKSADRHYPVMTLDELKALPVRDLAGDHCVLFLWSFATHILQALDLMAVWGFEYKTKFVWHKTNADGSPHLGTGFWVRDTYEDLLLGVRGDMPAPLPGNQVQSLIASPVGRHSEKPAAFRQMIESYFPDVARIELFAREAPAGWDAWGNEVGFVAADHSGAAT